MVNPVPDLIVPKTGPHTTVAGYVCTIIRPTLMTPDLTVKLARVAADRLSGMHCLPLIAHLQLPFPHSWLWSVPITPESVPANVTQTTKSPRRYFDAIHRPPSGLPLHRP